MSKSTKRRPNKATRQFFEKCNEQACMVRNDYWFKSMSKALLWPHAKDTVVAK